MFYLRTTVLFAAMAALLFMVASAAIASEDSEVCEGSWYGPGFYGNLTANGEVYSGEEYTAASPYLPFGTRVEVTNLLTGEAAIFRINDRGPYVHGRCIDLSAAGSHIVGGGVAPVRVTVLG